LVRCREPERRQQLPMKKIKLKDKSGDKAQELVAKELTKKPGKSQVVKLKPKKGKTFTWPAVGEYWNRSVQFIKEAWIELKKVNWPSQKETVGATAVVLVLVMLVSFYLGMVDLALSRLMKAIVG
jgi:preprotein translocase subunit SecE